MHISMAWYNRAIVLKEKFCKFGECDKTYPDKIPEHTPEPLCALLSVSGEWHIMPNHCDVFGCNLFAKGTFLDKVNIIGDKELVEEWKNEHSTPNCGEEGWECLAAISEFDFLFVCMEPTSPYYGHLRHVVNNCWEDNPFLDSFNAFFEHLELFTDTWLASYTSDDNAEEDDLDKELPQFLSF